MVFSFSKNANQIIARRVLLLILIFSGIVTLMISAIQIYFEYERDIHALDDQFKRIEAISINPLAQSLWFMNEDSINLQLDGILNLRDIEYLELAGKGNIFFTDGKKGSKHTIERIISLTHKDDSGESIIGKLTVVASKTAIYSRLFDRLITILVSQSIIIFLLSIFIFLIVHHLVIKHLSFISSYLKGIDIEKPHSEIALKRRTRRVKDELDQVVISTNEMIQRQKDSYSKIEQVVKKRTAELTQKNDQLRKEMEERRQAEETLRESEGKYRGLVEGLDEAMYRMSLPDGKYEYMSPAVRKVFGCSAEKFIENPLTVRELIPPDFAEYFKEKWADLIEGKFPPTYTYKILDPEGNERWIVQSNTGIFDDSGNIIAIEGLCRDITKEVQAEKALRESEELHKEAQRVAHIGHWELYPEIGTPVWSDEIFRIFGLNPQEHEPSFTDHETHSHPDDWPLLNKAVTLASTEGTPFDIIFRIVRPDGEIRWMHSIGTTSKNEKGKVVKLFGTAQDITDRKQAEVALQESEERYRLLVENQTDMIVKFDADGYLTFVSRSYCKAFGKSEDELLGKKFIPLIHDEDKEAVVKALDKMHHPPYIAHVEERAMTKDGWRWQAWLNTAVLNEKNEVEEIVAVGRDINKQKQLEEERIKLEAQLQQAQKMEAISTLAGGVAHEFNNTLMGIMGNIELLRINCSDDGGIDKQLESMKGAGYRMSRLTAQLLAYAEGGKYQPKNLKLNDFVIETLPIIQHELSPVVRLVTHFQKDISFVKADHAQMQMALSAILTNASEAIEDEGIIRISAENKDIDEDFTKHHPGPKPGLYVCLTIEDDGKGMDEETKSGIFEPFFTTKFQGRGMGMAAVYGVVRNHDGWISVESELGKGTIVRIYLPAIEVEIEKPKKTKAEATAGTGTILMIEDEDVVIEVTQAMLEMLGYRVMVAKTGKDAIHIAETFDGQIDLALLDIKLPDINGRNLYPLIMKARSNLKVIVWSGYSIDGPAREILDAGAQDFIQKPFSIATLSEKLKAVLEGE